MDDDTGINNGNSPQPEDENSGVEPEGNGVSDDSDDSNEDNPDFGHTDKTQTGDIDDEADFPEPGELITQDGEPVPPDDVEPEETAGTDTETGRPDPYSHLRKHQWRPGQSGNLKGRPPKDRSMRERLKQLIRADAGKFDWAKDLMGRLVQTGGVVDDKAIDGMDLGDVLLLVSVFKAARGDSKHLSMILERSDGKVVGAFNDQRPEATDAGATINLQTERIEALNFYRAIINDPEVSTRERMDARRELNLLLGLTKDTDARQPIELATAIMAATAAMEMSTSESARPVEEGAE